MDRPVSKDKVAPQFGLEEFGLFAIVIVAWGWSWYAIRCQLGVVPVEVSVFWRFVLAGILTFTWVYFRKEPMRFGFSDHWRLAVVGACLFCFNFMIIYSAGYFMPSGLVAVIFSLSSIFNLLLAAIFLRSGIEGRVAIGGIVGTVGVAFLFWPQIQGTEFGHMTLYGLGLAATGTLIFCFGNLFSTIVQRRGVPLLAATAWSTVYGCILLFGLCLVRGREFSIDWTFSYIGGLLYLAVIASVVGFSAYLSLLRRVGASRASYSTVITPIIALTTSTFLEGYHWTMLSFLGVVLAIIGNIIVIGRPRSKPAGL